MIAVGYDAAGSRGLERRYPYEDGLKGEDVSEPFGLEVFFDNIPKAMTDFELAQKIGVGGFKNRS